MNERQERRARHFVCSAIIDKRTSGREEVKLDAAKMVKTAQRQARHEKVETHTIGTGPGSLSHICAAAREGRRQRDCGSAAALNSESAAEFKIPLSCYFAIHRERRAKPVASRTPEAPSPAAAGEGASARENAPCWSATSCSPTD